MSSSGPGHFATCVGRNMHALAIVIFGVTALPVQTARAQIAFEEVTAQSGIRFTGRSMGLSWGDYNNDGWPDLYTSNHKARGALYVNHGNGTFTNILPANWTNPSTPDKHGAGWGDFDNDGDQDLMQMSGAGQGSGSSPNLFLVVHDSFLTNEAAQRGLQDSLGRGRTPLWMDWNNDGWLDLFFANLIRPDGQAPSVFYQQTNGVFNVANVSGLTLKYDSMFAQTTDLLGNGTRMVIIHGATYPQRVITVGDSAAVDLRTQLHIPTTNMVRDVAIEDFNGDLRPDFFLTRLDIAASEAVQTNARTLKSYFNVRNTERGVMFKCNCTLSFTLGPGFEIKPGNIFIGAGGSHPSASTFSVSAADAAVRGIASHTGGVSYGFYVGYDAATQVWTVLASKADRLAVNALVTSSADITGLKYVNLNSAALDYPSRLLLQTPTGFIDSANNPQVAAKTACESVVAGDFDNDMDMDIYLVCRGQVQNRPNRLLVNNGSGAFQLAPLAGGAEGSTAGRGDSGGAADFDNDGFLDLFITNGNGEPPFTEGPYQLFRNVGNANHWLELHLRGVRSNRDGVGAKVIITAGGTRQVRQQSGGVHRIAQNHERLHFGLGGNTLATQITISWPSGTVQTLYQVPADQIMDVTEPTRP